MNATEMQIQAYLEAKQPQGIAVIAGPASETARLVRITSLQEQPDGTVFDMIWFERSMHADAVMEHCECADTAAPRWLSMTPLQLRDRIIDAAASLGADWSTTEELTEHAAAVVAEITQKVDTMRQSGALADLNSNYKNYRQQQIAKGEKAKPYSAFLADFTMNMITLTAQHATT